jgi:hypothetical protein
VTRQSGTTGASKARLTRHPAFSNGTLIFIPYRRSDSQSVAGRIYDRLLQSLPPQSVFKDVDSIPYGVDFRQHLAKVIQDCTVVFVVIGQDWLTVTDFSGRRRLDNPADFVRIEVEEALKRDIPVIPLLVDDAPMPAESELPSSLKGLAYRNGIAIRHDPDFHTDMTRLMRDMKLTS